MYYISTQVKVLKTREIMYFSFYFISFFCTQTTPHQLIGHRKTALVKRKN